MANMHVGVVGRNSGCTQQGESKRERRTADARSRGEKCIEWGGGAARGKYREASTKLNNKIIRKHRICDLDIYHYLTREIKRL